jgi:glutamyl-tRNA reductase
VSEETRAGEDRPPWAIQAEQVAAAGIAAYLAWRRSRASATVVRALRARAEERRQDRVGRFLRGQPELSQEARAAIEALTRRIVGDLLHEPLVALRADEDGSRGAAARGLFGL